MRKINYCIPNKAMVVTSEEYVKERKSNIKLAVNAVGNKRESLNFKFSGYVNNKDIIRYLIGGCCAYCGDKITQHTPVVEHYRPKNRLTYRKNEFIINNGRYDKRNKSTVKSLYGYFLWGSHYKNLLPACRPCNTGEAKKFGVYINGRLEYGIPYGKDDLFPVLKSKSKVDPLYVKSIKNEYPLIFNPYKDNPNELFSYKVCEFYDDGFIVIRPNKNLSRRKRLKAQISINVLGLNRQPLCEARWEIQNSVNSVLKSLIYDIQNSNYDIDNFVGYSNTLSKINNNGKGKLLGYSKLVSKKAVKLLHKTLRENLNKYSKSILTDTSSFNEKVFELEQFYTTRRKVDNKKNKLNKELQAIANEMLRHT
ncbi:hypothetical protein [Vibrio parahaemolyticus]|uniref:hypothetical protein n=1 Tax=Vibrio parahaemolyticus TaxID=670 RepID=UPI002119F41A|nr:hypothetical protein [Vibrio parahaemolyticus]MCQ9095782.1 hypothetical protein [Vibrio parahaemolyticus]HCG8095748.1 hypothetical protein [Vibrio parahaemolyticus]HCH6158826.1 hypothetical protein [Vibrio parahaemolyticus]